ncbi:hypothetical protein [Trichothermofontia sp.]
MADSKQWILGFCKSHAIAGVLQLSVFFQTASQALRSYLSFGMLRERRHYSQETEIWLVLICIGVFLAAYSSPILTMLNDSTGTLLRL